MSDGTNGSLESALLSAICDVESVSLPADVDLATRKEVLWAIGTGLAGASAQGSAALAEYVRDLGGKGEATVLGYGDVVPANLASLANSTYTKAYEYEDKIWIGTTHGYGVGMAVVPAALAAAEAVGGTDAVTFLHAIAVATDFQVRLLSAVPNATFGRSGFNTSYVLWVFGATAAAAKIMGLSKQQTWNALGLAYAQTAGNYQGQVEGVLGVRLQGGFAGRNAIMAVQLAARGVDGVRDFLTGQAGLYPVYYKGMDVDLGRIEEGLGDDFRGVRIGFKAYPCGLVCHAGLDSLRLLLKEQSIEADDVSSIRLRGGERLLIMAEPRETRQKPRNFVEAQFSAPWAVACTLVDGKLRLDHYGDAALANERYRSLSSRVEVEIDSALKEQSVQITMRDGSVLESPGVQIARGHPDNPLSVPEIIEIFDDCLAASPVPAVAENARALSKLLLDEDPSARFTHTNQLSRALRTST